MLQKYHHIKTKHVLGIAESRKYDKTVLKQRDKRGRCENTPTTLVVMEHDQIVQNDEEKAFSSEDEPEATTFYNIVLDEHKTPAEV